jgi:aspartate ammonia-lyase
VETSTATVTALLPAIGYDAASEIAAEVESSGRGVKEVALDQGRLTAEEFEALITPEAVCRLGMPRPHEEGLP